MAKSLICVTVTASTTAELRRRRDEVADADLIELRLDSVSDPSVAGALAGRRRPVVVTCRPRWEGGRFVGSEEEREKLLAEALSLGAEWVDLEWRAHFEHLMAPTGGHRVVLSMHAFDGIPPDLAARAQAMRATGAEVVKVAVKPTRLSDCVPLVEFGARFGRCGGLVLVGMGDYGVATRVVPRRFGSMWTYAGLEREVGQVTPSALLDDFRFRSLTESTEWYGLVGAPLAHSVSPAMHNAAFRASGFDAVYLPLCAADADDFVAFARAMGVKGASVTIPFKGPLFNRVDQTDALASQIGAINTIRIVDGRWLGRNTDAAGFLKALDGRVPLASTRAALLGAGGAARAVAVALAASGAQVTVHARDRGRAEDVARIASGRVGIWPPEAGSWDLLVNCTPIGMYPRGNETPLAAERLTGRYVYDLVYNPPVTRLLREAASAGCETIGGLEMLVAQAHEQFQWWTGLQPPAGVMQEAALKRLAEFGRDEHHLV